MTFQRILCPTDFSPGAETALRFATSLALQHRSELIILHSWHLPASAFSLEYPLMPEMTDQIMSGSRERLDEVVANTRKLGATEVRGELVSGVPWIEITGLIDNRGVDLCVIGTHGRTGITRVLLGSVAEKVVRHAHCSVLVIPPDREPTTFKDVLVPTDFSASADDAASLAASVVEPGGTLRLLHCIELPVMYGAPIAMSPEYDAIAISHLAETATRLKALTSARIETTHRIGSAGAGALSFLEEHPAIDLVVSGSHGRTGIRRALLGSVAEKLVRHAGRPVLIARTRASTR